MPRRTSAAGARGSAATTSHDRYTVCVCRASRWSPRSRNAAASATPAYASARPRPSASPHGQAEVIAERCIGCGNCVRVCSQHAKQVVSSIAGVDALLASGRRWRRCLAPSFPAEFPELDYRDLVGMLRALGFELVAGGRLRGRPGGARSTASACSRANAGPRYIATACPAIVGLRGALPPSTLSSSSRRSSPPWWRRHARSRRLHGDDLKVVFIGPCVAKKGEAARRDEAPEVDAVLTFAELRTHVRLRGAGGRRIAAQRASIRPRPAPRIAVPGLARHAPDRRHPRGPDGGRNRDGRRPHGVRRGRSRSSSPATSTSTPGCSSCCAATGASWAPG